MSKKVIITLPKDATITIDDVKFVVFERNFVNITQNNNDVEYHKTSNVVRIKITENKDEN